MACESSCGRLIRRSRVRVPTGSLFGLRKPFHRPLDPTVAADTIQAYGGTGRRAGLKIRCPERGVRVRVPLPQHGGARFDVAPFFIGFKLHLAAGQIEKLPALTRPPDRSGSTLRIRRMADDCPEVRSRRNSSLVRHFALRLRQADSSRNNKALPSRRQSVGRG